MFNYDFIKKENLHYLKSYKYKGVDKSLLYNYMFSPIANWCLQFVPLHIAPNTLSLMGLTCILIPHLLFLIIMGNQDFSGNVPTYLLWVTVVLHLLYMNFDNLDGKQARRTNNSSPLGMILDHNFDSMIILIQGTNLTTAMQFGNTVYSFALYSIPSVLFYIITHEEYYTHEMNMPIFNAAVEGTFSIAVLFAATAIFGTEMWRWRIPELDNVQVKFICMWIFFASAFLSLPFVQQLSQLRLIKIQKFIPLTKVFYQFKYMAFCYLAVLYVILFSPTNVGQTHMRSFLYLIGFTMSKGVGVVALNHVSNQGLPDYQNSIYMFISILGNTIYGQIFGVTLMDEGVMIAAYAFSAIVIHLHFLYNTSRQISGELGIKIFEINKN